MDPALDKYKWPHTVEKLMGLPDKAQKVFDKVVTWDRNLARKFQDKFNLTDYQMLCISCAKGFIIGAILL